MVVMFREMTFVKRMDSGDDPYEADMRLVFNDDGSAYRRIVSRVSGDHIDVPVTGNAIDYERRLIEIKQRMAESDDLARVAS